MADVIEPADGSYAAVTYTGFSQGATFRRIDTDPAVSGDARWFRIPRKDYPDTLPITWTHLCTLGTVDYLGAIRER